MAMWSFSRHNPPISCHDPVQASNGAAVFVPLMCREEAKPIGTNVVKRLPWDPGTMSCASVDPCAFDLRSPMEGSSAQSGLIRCIEFLLTQSEVKRVRMRMV